MSTEDLPQSAELASAYLDGDLDGPERAAAEAAPEVAAAIESFARVRAALGETGPIDPVAKEAAISAALAEFDAMHTTSTSVIVPVTSTAPAATTGLAPVVPLQPRRHRAYAVITGAAAAAIVVAVAVAALGNNGDTDDSATFASEAPAVAVADTTPQLKALTADAAATEAAPAEGTDSAAGASAADIASTAVPEIESPAALTEYAASMEVAATTAAPAATAAPPATQAASAPSDQQAPAPGGYAAVSCLSSNQVVIGSIMYQGTPALAVHNTATDTLQAIADTDCRVLDEVPSP